MHKQLVNQCSIEFGLEAQGPLLIKASGQGGDPTKPDMEFVETYRDGQKSIYLPGSSLKGAIRAYAEKLVRTVGGDNSSSKTIWANDPLSKDRSQKRFKREGETSSDIYKTSSFTEQMFGNTDIASRVRIDDAYPDPELPVILEERNSVAIDRVLGSTSGAGLFNYQVCTQGRFVTTLHLKNFSLAQLGLIGLVLRDLDEGWFSIGYGKSRGLGTMKVVYRKAVVQYPTCIVENDQIKRVGHAKVWPRQSLLGAGEFFAEGKKNPYGFPYPDRQEAAIGVSPMELGFGAEIVLQGDVQVKDLFMRSVKAWKIAVGIDA
ncbi:RAMP superfamily CRISPR-associated protein [Alkalinema pantanalense CENA528]|uniref:RAMP superfamily CRISPR-associated protein n=1 Tax=Alkalinema pantanalense TaxID=1620705 RepID=UPI003D6DEBCB